MSVLVASQRQTIKEVRADQPGTGGFGAKTILFNDNVHTFDEVANQLVRAIRCSFSQAMSFANQVHSEGSAIVYTGHLERCEAVAMVLEQIALKVKVEK